MIILLVFGDLLTLIPNTPISTAYPEQHRSLWFCQDLPVTDRCNLSADRRVDHTLRQHADTFRMLVWNVGGTRLSQSHGVVVLFNYRPHRPTGRKKFKMKLKKIEEPVLSR